MAGAKQGNPGVRRTGRVKPVGRSAKVRRGWRDAPFAAELQPNSQQKAAVVLH